MLDQPKFTLDSDGGRGSHAVITIQRDGHKVGTIAYRYYSWGIYDYYGQKLRGAEKLDAAKKIALTLEYPDPQSLYEQLCKDVERNRREYAEQKKEHVAALNAAARELIAGSSSASERIGEIFAAIERYAKDRDDGRWKQSNGAYSYCSGRIYYPPEPDSASPAQAAE